MQAEWVFHHPAMTYDALGYLPGMLHVDVDMTAAQQFDIGYRQYGGWNAFGKGDWKLGPDNSLKYPGDDKIMPLASTKIRDETICFYRSSFVAIIQPDRSFEVCRMD